MTQPQEGPGHAAGTANTRPLLSARGITAGYGRTTVLRDVSLSLDAGATVAVLGANGAGKTTLLRTLSGALRAALGTIELDGVDVTAAAPHRRARAGLCSIPDGRGVFRNLDVRDNLRLAVPPWSPSGSWDAALAAFPDLGGRLDQRAGSLSGGQQQMLALARAFVADPKLVLVDEVSMGLAPRLVDELFEALASLAAAGCALVIVEQFVQRALALAAHVLLLDHGEVVYSGSASDVDEQQLLGAYLGAELTA
jgi:branched-chain amino acid transport system ATP-binding protein